MTASQLLTAAELAARLGVTVETVYRMCRARKWPHSRIGRLYRFTEEHYQSIITPPAAPQIPRTQRGHIAQMLGSISDAQFRAAEMAERALEA